MNDSIDTNIRNSANALIIALEAKIKRLQSTVEAMKDLMGDVKQENSSPGPRGFEKPLAVEQIPLPGIETPGKRLRRGNPPIVKRPKGETWKILREALSTGLCTKGELMEVSGVGPSALGYHLKKHKAAIAVRMHPSKNEFAYVLRGA
ncbi:MAG: hypothetical protein WC291_00250 [Thermodesulfovibrionales bacterium]